MTKFLFWNLNKKPIPGFVCHLAHEQDVDVLILAECAFSKDGLLEELNREVAEYRYAWGVSDHLVFYTRFHDGFLRPLAESSRVSIRRLSLPGCLPMLVAAAHLPSKMSYAEDSQVFESVRLSRMISEVEEREGHHRTMVIGDLNMNPFEKGMVAAAGGLHAVPSRRVARRGERTVQGEKYRFFYNPMWSHLGDRAETGGTYYFDHGEPVCYYWNMFDQVLLRPALLEGFAPEQVKIVTEVGGRPLVERGRVDKDVASDHLPVVVELEISGSWVVDRG